MRSASIWLLAFLVSASAVHAQTFKIDASRSVAHTTNWANWDWEAWGPPDDAIDLKISGTFDLLIEPGGYHIFTGDPAPERISFVNANVTATSSEGRVWTFPTARGFYFGPHFEGSDDGCFGFEYYSWGSCYSSGPFGAYTGTYDGVNIAIKGMKEPSWATGENAYVFEVFATAVPEPSQASYLFAGLMVFLLMIRRNGIDDAAARLTSNR